MDTRDIGFDDGMAESNVADYSIQGNSVESQHCFHNLDPRRKAQLAELSQQQQQYILSLLTRIANLEAELSGTQKKEMGTLAGDELSSSELSDPLPQDACSSSSAFVPQHLVKSALIQEDNVQQPTPTGNSDENIVEYPIFNLDSNPPDPEHFYLEHMDKESPYHKTSNANLPRFYDFKRLKTMKDVTHNLVERLFTESEKLNRVVTIHGTKVKEKGINHCVTRMKLSGQVIIATCKDSKPDFQSFLF